jgi:hypothetical protein
MFKMTHYPRGLGYQYFHGIMVGKQIAAGNGIVVMPFYPVFLNITQGSGNTSLGSPGMRADWIHFGNHRDIMLRGEMQRSLQSGNTSADYDNIVCMYREAGEWVIEHGKTLLFRIVVYGLLL